MVRQRQHRRLNVFLNSRLVGQLNREASGAIDFRYDPTWLAWDANFPVSLSLPLREDRYIGPPVLAVFDNLLPDNDGIRRRLAEKVGSEGTDAFSMLASLGRDCVGALQFLTEDIDPGPAGIIEGEPITDGDIATVLRNLGRNPLGLEGDDDFRISIAGAQEKTALLKWDGRWMKPSGTTATTHIFKPQIGRLPNGIDLSNSVENEFLCLQLLRAIDLPTAEVAIETFEDVRVLVVERFDRLLTRDNRLLRRPQEDCCQALSVPWSRKYENEGGPGVVAIAKLLEGSDEASADRRHFLKSIVAFWLLAATDGHAKNFSIFLSPGGGYHLTPLYDVVSAQPSFDANQIRRNRLKLAMAVGDNRHYALHDITTPHFIESARKAGIGTKISEGIIKELIDVVPDALDQVLAALPENFPEAVSHSIDKGVRSQLQKLADGFQANG
jgi:serine/threonine-protein kinase HipA